MADTFSLISSTAVGVGGASYIEFTNIPTHFDDLVLKTVGRADVMGQGNAYSIKLNGYNTTFTITRVGGDSAIARYGNWANTTGSIGAYNGSTDTASQFSTHETRFPNYASSNYKTILANFATEANIVSRCYLGADSIVWLSTEKISSIRIYIPSGNFVQYSNAYLYGVRNV